MGYKECCLQEAVDPNASYCGSCRTPLLRCMSVQECGQLVEPFKPCPVCLAPQLVIDAGAVVNANVGDRLAIPLIIRNRIDAGRHVPRPIWVNRIFKRERDQDLKPVHIDWRAIDAGKEREFYLETGPFDSGGTDKVGVFLEVATRSKEGFEESHIFSGTLMFTVSAQTNSQQVVQNINLSGAHLEDNALLHIPSTNTGSARDESNKATEQRQVVQLDQVEGLEQDLGTRGYGRNGIQVSRAVKFALRGFSEEDAPGWEVGLGAKGYLAFGRSDRERNEETNPFPMDVRLRCYNRNGEQDLDSSLLLSRHHFDLLVLNDRLVVFARSGKGVILNDAVLTTSQVAQVDDGDSLLPLANQPDAPVLKFKFHSGPHGDVTLIEIFRSSR